MATDLETLLVRIDATTEGLRRELKKADRAVDQSGRNMEKTLTRIDKGFSSFGKGLIAAFSVAAIAKVGKEMVLAADRYGVLQGRIKEATRATGDYQKVSAELFAVAQRTGTALEDNVAMFQRLGTGAREFGASSDDILKVTETVQKLGIIGGTSAASISAGTMQFAQAMAAGVVRAEEWNSVVENMPELANSIAAGMGKTVGQMREAVLAGKVLSKDVFNVLLRDGTSVAARFEKMPQSIAQASTKLNNAMMAALGTSEDMASATTNISAAISKLADSLPAIVKAFDTITGSIMEALRLLGLMDRTAENARQHIRETAMGGLGGGRTPILPSDLAAAGLDPNKTYTREELLRLTQGRRQRGGVSNAGRAYSGPPVIVRDNTGKGAASPGGKADELPELIDGGFVGKSGASFPIDESAWFDPKEQADRIARIGEEADAIRAASDPMVALAQEIERINALTGEHGLSTDEAAAAIGRLSHQALLASETLEGGFARALQGMEYSLSSIDWFAGNIFKQIVDAFKQTINDMINEAFRLSVIQPLMKSIFGAASGGSGGGVFGSIFGIGSGTLGGARAGGGPVTANTPYLVGERGPEMFVPGSSGGIVPNHKMGGGQAVVVNIHNHYDVGLEGVDQRIRQHTPKIAAQAAQAVRNANQRTAGAFIR